MKTLVLNGMWYGDVTADGASVASARDGSHVLLSGERIDVPREYGGVLQVRISPEGIQFGGQPQTGTRCIVFNGVWHDLDSEPIGPNSLIFDRFGIPHVAIAGAHTPTGSLGYWYVADDGRLVPSVEVYGPTASVPRLSLHTTLYHRTQGWISVGQGDVDTDGQKGGGVAAWINGRLVLVARGYCEFIRLAVGADRIGICWAEQKIPRVTFLWLTVEELAAMPDYPSASEPVPIPVPQPQPEPVPMPEPQSLFPTVERIWQQYGGLNRGAMLNEIAWEHRADGWGLSRKGSGFFVGSPVGPIASDILHHRPSDTLWDVFTDEGPMWGQAEHHHSPDRPWVAPVPPGGSVPLPVPSPVPVPQPPTSGSIDALVDARIAAAVKPLQATIATQEARIKALEARLVAQPAFPARLALKSVHGKYVSAEGPDQRFRVIADRDGIGAWEIFTVEPVE